MKALRNTVLVMLCIMLIGFVANAQGHRTSRQDRDNHPVRIVGGIRSGDFDARVPRVVISPRIGYVALYEPGYMFPYYNGLGYYNTYNRDLGKVSLKTNVKNATVFINGAPAGEARNLKNIYLRPSVYNISVIAPGYVPYTTKVFVTIGNTIKIKADLLPL